MRPLRNGVVRGARLVSLAIAGLTARMVVFCTIGVSVLRAAERYDPDEATGLDGALRELADRPYGPWILAAVGLGLITFGLYQLAQARYRDFSDDPTADNGRRSAETQRKQ